jgi:hypothetical protein
MPAEWQAWARQLGWKIEDDSFWVPVGHRRQRLTVVGNERSGALQSRVARRAVLNGIVEPERRAWERNRVSELVGFRVDRHGVMLAETPLPADVRRGEWEYLSFNLARAADRFENLLTGLDEE